MLSSVIYSLSTCSLTTLLLRHRLPWQQQEAVTLVVVAIDTCCVVWFGLTLRSWRVRRDCSIFCTAFACKFCGLSYLRELLNGAFFAGFLVSGTRDYSSKMDDPVARRTSRPTLFDVPLRWWCGLTDDEEQDASRSLLDAVCSAALSVLLQLLFREMLNDRDSRLFVRSFCCRS